MPAVLAEAVPVGGMAHRAVETRVPRALLYLLRAVAVLLGAAGAAAGALNESMNSDGISYLDIGDAYFRGDWITAINATWSPLYAVILGAVMKIVQPGMTTEFAVAHGVNFVIFIVALLCFEFFWREAALRYYAEPPGAADPPARLPAWAFAATGYGLFIWCSTALIPVFAVTPDMLVAASVYAAAGLLLRAGGPRATWKTFAGLGAVLALGYLAKAAMFPLAFVFFACAALQAVRTRRSLTRMVPAIAAFAIVGGPFVLVLSLRAGHPTFSDVGPFAYLKHVYEVPVPPYAVHNLPARGELRHPLTTFESTPPVYSYGDAVGGTYPIGYEPAHWLQGLEAPFNTRLQLRALAGNVQYYFNLFFRLQGPLLGVMAVLLLLALGGAGQRVWSADGWQLALIACAAFGMYGLVYVTGRYIGGFVVLLWAGLLMMVRLRASASHALILRCAGAALAFVLAVNIATYHLDGLNAMLGIVPSAPGLVSSTPPPAARPSVVARHLASLGVEPGDRVGVLGYAFDSFWARLARVRIAGEVAPADLEVFWAADSERRQEVERVFAALGARAIVAEQVPEHVSLPGWTRLGETSYYALILDQSAGGQ